MKLKIIPKQKQGIGPAGCGDPEVLNKEQMMKLTKEQLQKIIKEEVENILEQGNPLAGKTRTDAVGGDPLAGSTAAAPSAESEKLKVIAVALQNLVNNIKKEL
tara:strand:- start:639 stop:947 length:309 start_codon:yes stop_codon:yes gene_type:complete